MASPLSVLIAAVMTVGLSTASADTAASAPAADFPPAPTAAEAHGAAAEGFRGEGSVVVHWGADDSGKEWTSDVLDASVPENNDPANFSPPGVELPRSAGKSAAAAGWLCSTWAKPTAKKGRYLSSSSHELCSGSYLYHYTRGQFLRSSWSGPRAYTSWTNSRFVYSPTGVNDTLWTIGCPGGGTYNYNLQVRTHLVDTRGDHGGPYEVGKYVRASCGT